MLTLTLRDYELLVQLFIYSFLFLFFFFCFQIFYVLYISTKMEHIFNPRCENYAKKLISVNL